jgi:hypothetical protein
MTSFKATLGPIVSADLSPLITWINEREAIRIRKDLLERNRATKGRITVFSREMAAWEDPRDNMSWTPHVLTHDPILTQYRFCNVRREDDRVTRWIKANIRDAYPDQDHLWYMLAAARYINWPPTLEYLIRGGQSAWPNMQDFTPEKMTAALEAWKAAGNKVETGAYMIRAESDPKAPWYSWSKQRYVSEIVLGKLWEERESWEWDFKHGKITTMERTWEILQNKHYTGWGPFMAYQWVVDLRWTRYLQDAPDIQTWAAVGPGSRRGLNRLHGRPVTFALRQDDALREMIEIREAVNSPGATAPWVGDIDLSDIQNCLCEVDKYIRVQTGEGRPRSQYVPGRGW